MNRTPPGRLPVVDGRSLPRRYRLALGALLGAVGMLGMVRLCVEAFGAAWLSLLVGVVMLAWVGYLSWRVGASRPGWRPLLAALVLALVGALAGGWGHTGGSVLALACSLAGYLVVRLPDRSAPSRRSLGWDRNDPADPGDPAR